MAHIVAFKKGGPRGSAPSRGKISDINSLNNLMLLCPDCHHKIDTGKNLETVESLKKHKKQHEARVYHLTGLDKEHESHVVVIKSRIYGEIVDVADKDIYEAIAPYYPSETRCEIDLTTISEGDNDAYLTVGRQTIRAEIGKFNEYCNPCRVSVFGLARIPLLVFLGAELSNKITVRFFQKHRDTNSWAWKTRGEIVRFSTKRIRHDKSTDKVAVSVSLTGPVDPDLVTMATSGATIYEIRPINAQLSATLIRRQEDLDEFRFEFERLLPMLMEKHPGIQAIHLFLAAPAPVALLCGHVPLKTAHPTLAVYELNSTREAYRLSMEVNRSDA